MFCPKLQGKAAVILVTKSPPFPVFDGQKVGTSSFCPKGKRGWPLPPLFEFCFFMYYVYIIKQATGKLYIGYTTDLRRRLKEHKLKLSDLIYYEAYKSKEDAIRREQRLKEYKSAWGQLKKRITKSRI